MRRPHARSRCPSSCELGSPLAQEMLAALKRQGEEMLDGGRLKGVEVGKVLVAVLVGGREDGRWGHWKEKERFLSVTRVTLLLGVCESEKEQLLCRGLLMLGCVPERGPEQREREGKSRQLCLIETLVFSATNRAPGHTPPLSAFAPNLESTQSRACARPSVRVCVRVRVEPPRARDQAHDDDAAASGADRSRRDGKERETLTTDCRATKGCFDRAKRRGCKGGGEGESSRRRLSRKLWPTLG